VSDARSSSATGTITAEPAAPYRGRFAPSPSGPLHFGSVIAAVGSYLEARTRGGEWLVRIEDLDPPREKPGAADQILRTLEALGLHWDGPVLRQSSRNEAYQSALRHLEAMRLTFSCRCSRSRLSSLPQNAERREGEELFHPEVCQDPGADGLGSSTRFRSRTREISFDDRSLGPQRFNVAKGAGAFVLRRRDGYFAYQLAVVVDDASQGITDVVRGADLLGSTPRQILLQEALGLPRLTYMHLPLAVTADGDKLSKSGDAPAVDSAEPAPKLTLALAFLGQDPPGDLARASLADLWSWAVSNWRPQQFSGIGRREVVGAHRIVQENKA